MRTQEELNHAFTYHKPSGDQPLFYEDVRERAKAMAQLVFDFLPSTPERTIALRKIQEAVMAANLACALHGLNFPEDRPASTERVGG